MAANIPSLPTEIKLSIVNHISTKAEVLNLLNSDSTFFYICQPILYRWIRLHPDSRATTARTIRWCRSIQANRTLALYVQEVDFLSHRRRSGRWLAGGALIRTIINTLCLLKNLKSLRFFFRPHSSSFCMIDHPRLGFPSLKSLACVGTYKFLKRHGSVRKLHLLDMVEFDTPEENQVKGLLPNLTCYSGRLRWIAGLDPQVRLLRISSTRHQELEIKGADELGIILRVHGQGLRSLHLNLSRWEKEDIILIAEQAPRLETLQIELGFIPIAPGKFVLEDIIDSGVQLASLQRFQLLSYQIFSTVASGLELPEFHHQSDYIYRLHKAFPTLRLIQLSLPPWRPSTEVLEAGWRYNEPLQLWIPPESHDEWWLLTAQGLAVTRKHYQDALPVASSIHGPLLEWHPLL